MVDEEEFLAAEPIGQPAEKQSADDGAEQVGAAGQSDLGIGEIEAPGFPSEQGRLSPRA